MNSLIPDLSRSPFYIFAPRYTTTSAGVRCLHLLCHWLNRSGERAYIALFAHRTGIDVHPDLLTPVLSQEIVDRHFDQGAQPIVVYPEVISGNPAVAECVVRYVLNFPGLLGGDKKYPESDLVFGFSRQLAKSCGVPDNVLHMPVIDRDVFHSGERRLRRGACFYAMKYQNVHGQQVFGLPIDAIEITRDKSDSQTPQEIAELFRSCEQFYCFENTALAIEAVLCGCPTVFMPNPYLLRPIAVDELGWDGFAWGNSSEEVQRASSTVAGGTKNYMRTINQFHEQLMLFTNAALSHASGKAYIAKISLAPAITSPEYDEFLIREIVKLIIQKKRWNYMEIVNAFRAIIFR